MDGILNEPDATVTGNASQFQHRIAAVVNRSCGSELKAEQLAAAADHVCARWQSGFGPDPDAAGVLDTIRRKVIVALVSNFAHPPHVTRLVDEMGLAHLFQTVVISGDVGIEKPDPGIMAIACERIGVDASRCAYVGNSFIDYRAATAAGMFFFWVHRPEDAQGAGIDDKYADTDAELLRRGERGEIRVLSSLRELLE
jgi:HAD superfamily hydrolase (TIGR01549 family)